MEAVECPFDGGDLEETLFPFLFFLEEESLRLRDRLLPPAPPRGERDLEREEELDVLSPPPPRLFLESLEWDRCLL